MPEVIFLPHPGGIQGVTNAEDLIINDPEMAETAAFVANIHPTHG
jgi:hypothetical protein